jgi:hypothetical protein
MRTITNEVGSGPISISTPDDFEFKCDRRAEGRSPLPETNDNVTPAIDGRQKKTEIGYRPDKPPPAASVVTAIDGGRCPQPANDNRHVRYHLREMAQRGELGINEPENRRHWYDAERFKIDLATSQGEFPNDSAAIDWRELALPYLGEEMASFDTDAGLTLNDDGEFVDTDMPGECGVVDNAKGEPDQIRVLHALQLIALAQDVLGHDFKVNKRLVADNWTARMIGEDEGFMDRASASACGKGIIRSALRNLSRFYVGIDRLEESGQRPPDVWPLVGTVPRIRHPREYRWLRHSYMNQTRTHVVRVTESRAA